MNEKVRRPKSPCADSQHATIVAKRVGKSKHRAAWAVNGQSVSAASKALRCFKKQALQWYTNTKVIFTNKISKKTHRQPCFLPPCRHTSFWTERGGYCLDKIFAYFSSNGKVGNN